MAEDRRQTDDRRKAEDEWIAHERDRAKNDAAQAAAASHGAPAVPSAPEGNPASLDSILKSTREPQFVSAALRQARETRAQTAG